MKSIKYVPLFMILLLQIIACSDNKDPVNTVASVGGYDISFEDLELSFKLNPMYAIRTPYSIARRSQLNFLIENKYYLITAKKVDLQDDPLVEQRLQYITSQEIIKAYLRESFYNRIKLVAEEQKTALKKLSERRSVQYLRSRTRAGADSLLRLLEQGKAIDLPAAQLQKQRISGGEVGQITFGDLDEKMETAVYDLEQGQYSGIVESAGGYFIFYVTDIIQNRDILKMDLNSRLNYVNRILHNRKMDKRIREYLRTLSNNRRIEVNNRLVDMLLQAVSDESTTPPDIFSPQIETADLERIRTDFVDYSGEIVARFGEDEISLGEFLHSLKIMPPLHRPNLSTRNRLIQSIIDIIRDDLLLADAREKDIHDLESVRKKIEENSEEYLAAELKQRLVSRDFRQENPLLWRRYQDTFEEVKTNTPVQISEQILFHDIENPDSVLAPPPVMLFLKDRYIW